MAPSERNNNMVPALIAKSNAGDSADVIVWADPATHRLLVNASVAISGGSKSTNAAVPTSDNIGALVAVANASAPTYSEGFQVLLSTDLTGALRVTGSLSVGGVVDNTAFTAGTTQGSIQQGFYHAAVDSVTDGRSAAVAITVKRAQHVSIFDASGNAMLGQKAMAAAIPVVLASDQSAIPVSQSGTWNIGTVTAVTAISNALPAGTNLMGKVGLDQTTPGTTNAIALAQINAATTLAGNGATGTGSLRVTLANDTSAIAGWGLGATGAAVPSGAQYTGLMARTTNPSAATDGNMVGASADKLGRQIVVIGQARDLKGNQLTTITSSTSETTVVTAVASTFLDVYGCIVENTSATATKVTFKDSTAGTTQFEIYVPAGDTRGFMLPSSDGFKQTTVNNNWTATCGTSVASVVITMLYAKNI